MEDQSQKIILDEITKVKSDSLKKKLLYIKKLTNDREVIEKYYKNELLDLTYAYEQKYKSIYDQVSKMIHGQEECDVDPADQEKFKVTKPTTATEAGVPGFWHKALTNSKFFYTNDKDEGVLKFLKDVNLEFKTDKASFTAHFVFEANPYFSNTDITKSFIYNESQELIKIESSTIAWASDDVNPTKILKKTQKKGKGKKTAAAETQQKYEDVESFFTIFRTDNLEDCEAEADASQEEEEAEFIKEDLFPFALSYYLNIMPVDEDLGDEDEEEEDDDHGHGGHGHHHGKKGKAKGGDEQKEKCKNQ